MFHFHSLRASGLRSTVRCVESSIEYFEWVGVRRSSDDSVNFAVRFWRSLRNSKSGKDSEPVQMNSKAESGSGNTSNAKSSSDMVVVNPEDKFREVFAVELNRRPLMPGTAIPVVVSNMKLIDELSELKKSGVQAYVGAFLRKPEEKLTGVQSFAPTSPDAASHLYEVGTFAQVHMILPADGQDTTHLMLLGHKRIRRMSTTQDNPLKVKIQGLMDKPHTSSDHMKAMQMEILSTMRELFHLHPLYTEQLKSLQAFGVGANMSSISRLTDIGAGLTNAEDNVLQGVLEELDVDERGQRVLEILKKEIELVKLQQQIGKQVEEKINKDQRKYFLMEQLKSIKKELGLEKDDKSALIQKFKEKFSTFEATAPEQAKTVIEEELEKLSALEPVSSEFNVTRNYLDWLTSIPWGKYSEERLDVQHARQVLDDDHYGLTDVKERILEFIAVGLLKGATQGKMVCLVGPPGVGKTSIGKSVARALNRKYYRFSVGGLSDVAEIKGHRRTYVGAMPGKIVQCLKSTGSSNPLVLIDEIDKLGKGYQGDPASALLELLDPEQNSGFLDHYLDVPIDLSKVLFMCTANVLDTIPGPLLDRMEVIRLSGYIFSEKVAIGRKYLEVQIREATGTPENSVVVEDPAMNNLIQDYCREAGVRNLKNQLEKLYRKAALKLVTAGAVGPKQILEEQKKEKESKEASETNEIPEKREEEKQKDAWESGEVVSEEDKTVIEGTVSKAPQSEEKKEEPLPTARYEGDPVVIKTEDLAEYLGQPPFRTDKFYPTTPPGVVMGLAWTAMGGSTLYAESAVIESSQGKGSITCTGKLGEVMKESATIAHTFARSFHHSRKPDDSFFADTSIHIHFPEGAVPKDGPSAGVTLITSLLSLANKKPVMSDLAMTGEVTLTGRVLPIGGVKEKTIAARRSQVKTIVFPEGNRKDFEELADDVKEGLNVHFVDTYQDVYKIALGYNDDGN